MGRQSKVQKKVQDAVQSVPKKPRKKRVVKVPPAPFFIGAMVKVTSPSDFKGTKLGLIRNVCKDGGMNVNLTLPRHEGVADYVCIHIDRGQTIELLNDTS